MVIIINHSAYHARAIKMFDAKTRKLGYDFSYPILNTIDIGNLLIMGGSTSIQIERMGETTWSFDKEKSQLTIQKNDKTEKHYIEDVLSLCQKMAEHYEANRDRLYELNMATAQKKSHSQKGNKNAVKKEMSTPVVLKDAPSQTNEKALFKCEIEESLGNKYTQLTVKEAKKEDVTQDKLPDDFIWRADFEGSDNEYYIYVKTQKREWLPFLSFNDLKTAFDRRIFEREDIPENVLKEYPSFFMRNIYVIKEAPRGKKW